MEEYTSNVELSINKKPILSCYGYESYNCSIATADKYVNKTVARIDDVRINERIISDDSAFRFDSERKGLSCSFSNNELSFIASNEASILKGNLYINVDSDVDISFCVKEQRYTSPWAYVSVFASLSISEMSSEAKHEELSPYIFGNYKKSGLFKLNGSDYLSLGQMVSQGDEKYWLRLSKRKSKVYSYSSFDGEHWQLYDCSYVDIGENCIVGIHLDFDEFFYYNWLYSNHLQIYCDRSFSRSVVPIDYFYPVDILGFSRDNPFIEEHRIPNSLLSSLDIRFEDLLHKCVDLGFYMDLSLNERFINNRSAYSKRDFYHYNMIYGYNDESNTVNLIGYNHLSKLDISCESIWNIQKANDNIKSDVILRKFDMGYFPVKLDVSLIKNLLEDYISGTDSSERYHGICVKRDSCAFGISVYDTITESDNNFAYFLHDVRMAYFLVEHKRIMNERVKFLCERSLLIDDDEHILVLSTELMRMTDVLLSLVIKYSMCQTNNTAQRIRELITSIKEKDLKLCRTIIEGLQT